MTSNDLRKLRTLFLNEVKRREKINTLLKDDSILEFIHLANIKYAELSIEDRTILKEVLGNFKVTKTNGIYVCIGAYYTSWSVTYEETDYYNTETSIDSSDAEHKNYMDIESGRLTFHYTEKADKTNNKVLCSDFEKEHIVLNPYNSSKNLNGYDEVREDFFNFSVKYGQPKAKELILKKYPRINN